MDERESSWPLRAAILAVLGAAVGLAAWLLLTGSHSWNYTQDPLRIAGASWLVVSGIILAFVLERERIGWAALFALAAGLVGASVAYWNGAPDQWDDAGRWRLVSAGLAIAIAAPLFQVTRDQGGWRPPYTEVHRHAWTNVVIWCAAWLFVGIVWLLVWLLSALFQLIGIDFIHDVIDDAWFAHMLTGGAFGGAVGLLRERDRIVGTLRRVVTAILSVLAPVLGVGLLIFLLALPFTGLAPLWEATKSTTPILLGCVIGALILANAVIGDSAEDEGRLPPLRYGAMALAAAMLPLALIAAVSTGLRINQYGLTPDRLWAVVFTIIATAYGLAYLVALVRRRLDWGETVRPANLRLAIGLGALALLLSTPLLSFGAISARDQLVRLESGRTTVDKFDWAALRFDFGPAGKRALEQLKAGAAAPIRAKAAEALAATDRWVLADKARVIDARAGFADRVMIFPANMTLPPELIDAMTRFSQCGAKGDSQICIVRYEAGGDRAVLVHFAKDCPNCAPNVTPLLRLPSGSWGQVNAEVADSLAEANNRRKAAASRGDIEIRTVERKQVFLGGEPMGQAFE
jgi:hypothetical protein